jgi:photosystem II stability/assembly factor-like uncharacterized protein
MFRSHRFVKPGFAGILLACFALHGLSASGQEAGKKDEAKSRWTVVKSGVKQRLTCVRFVTPELGWVVGWDSTILHTKDGGKTWTKQTPPSAGTKLDEVIFADSKTGYAISSIYKTIFRTTNGGDTWENVPLPYPQDAGKAFAIHAVAGDSYFFAYSSAIYRTDNGGKNWTELTDKFPRGTSMSFTSKDAGFAVRGEGESVAMTTDGGKSWKSQTIKISPSNWMKIQSVDAKTGFIIPQYGPIHRTTDGGKTWQPLKLNPSPGPWYDLHFLNAKVGHVFHSNHGDPRSQAVSQTTDGGDSWKELEVLKVAPSYVTSMSFPSINHGVVVGYDGFIARYQAK